MYSSPSFDSDGDESSDTRSTHAIDVVESALEALAHVEATYPAPLSSDPTNMDTHPEVFLNVLSPRRASSPRTKDDDDRFDDEEDEEESVDRRVQPPPIGVYASVHELMVDPHKDLPWWDRIDWDALSVDERREWKIRMREEIRAQKNSVRDRERWTLMQLCELDRKTRIAEEREEATEKKFGKWRERHLQRKQNAEIESQRDDIIRKKEREWIQRGAANAEELHLYAEEDQKRKEERRRQHLDEVRRQENLHLSEIERAFQKQKELDARRAENIRKIQEDARRVEKALIEQWREDDRRRKEGLLAAFQEKSSKKTSMVIEFERKMKARAQSEERVLVLEKLRDEREAAREKRRLQGVLDALKRKS